MRTKLIFSLIVALIIIGLTGVGSIYAGDKSKTTSKTIEPATKTEQPTPVIQNTTPPSSRTGEQINWQVISSGGGSGSSASYNLSGTIGQTATGGGSSASYPLAHGFWQDFGSPTCCDLPGDIDNSGSVDISDLTYYVDYMFGGGDPAPCFEEGDVNGSCTQDISDLTYFVDYMFGGGPAPVCAICS